MPRWLGLLVLRQGRLQDWRWRCDLSPCAQAIRHV
jgi:hypothetical protein